VFSALGGFALLGEVTSLRQWAGILIIVSATFAIARAGHSQHEGDDRQRVRRGILMMAAVAVLWATTPVLDKLCLRMVPASEHALLQCFGVAALLFGWARWRGGKVHLKQVTSRAPWFTLAVGAAAIALFAQFWAIRFVPVGIFEALKRSYGLISALGLGYLVFREPVSRTKIFLVLFLAFGIFVLMV
jgi:drug/metabolite transporter (DMT)-like permease